MWKTRLCYGDKAGLAKRPYDTARRLSKTWQNVPVRTGMQRMAAQRLGIFCGAALSARSENLAGVHDALRVQRGFDCAHHIDRTLAQFLG